MSDPLTAAWLSEMWPTCREPSRSERLEKREADAIEQALMDAQSVQKNVHREAS